jgi:hypothetical protein
MVEELRSYLLNSKKYSSKVYLDESFEPTNLTKELNEFRDAILGQDSLTDPLQQIYRANFISRQIYNNDKLKDIALKMFDSRLIEDTAFVNENFDPQILIDSKNENFVISVIPGAALEREIVEQNISISNTMEFNKLRLQLNSSVYSIENDIVFEFNGGLSSFVDLPRTPLRVALRGGNSIPPNFKKVLINIKYPYFFDINKSIEGVQQIGSLDFFIFQNNEASKNLLSIYNSFTRWNDRLMCLALGYAINLKYK